MKNSNDNLFKNLRFLTKRTHKSKKLPKNLKITLERFKSESNNSKETILNYNENMNNCFRAKNCTKNLNNKT